MATGSQPTPLHHYYITTTFMKTICRTQSKAQQRRNCIKNKYIRGGTADNGGKWVKVGGG